MTISRTLIKAAAATAGVGLAIGLAAGPSGAAELPQDQISINFGQIRLVIHGSNQGRGVWQVDTAASIGGDNTYTGTLSL